MQRSSFTRNGPGLFAKGPGLSKLARVAIGENVTLLGIPIVTITGVRSRFRFGLAGRHIIDVAFLFLCGRRNSRLRLVLAGGSFCPLRLQEPFQGRFHGGGLSLL